MTALACMEENARLKEVQDRDRACLFGISKENADTELALLDMTGEYEAGLRLLQAKDAENARLRANLEHIAKWEPKDYEAGAEYWTWGNYDDAYRYGVDSAYSAAAKYAKSALSVPAPSTHRLVSVERLRELANGWHGTDGIEIGLCPVCDKKREQGHARGCWLGEATRETS